MVMRGAVAVPTHFEHHASRHELVWTMHEDVLDNGVGLSGILVIRVHFLGCITQSHMLPWKSSSRGRSWVVPYRSHNWPSPTFTR